MKTAEQFPYQQTELGMELHRLYDEWSLNRNDGHDCPLFEDCDASCIWDLAEARITAPTGAYVGKKYHQDRWLFIGINTNRGSEDSTEFYSSYKWISEPKSEGSPHIDGAIHRMVKKLLRSSNLEPNHTKDHFAFTNIVKCSVTKAAGRPTGTMFNNCTYRQQHIFKELDTLKPKWIFALGDLVFDAIRYVYHRNVKTAGHKGGNFKGWVYTYDEYGYPTTVIRLYNPGQGYQTPRRFFKNITREDNLKYWQEFFSEDLVLSDDIHKKLDNLYPDMHRIDKSNSFYDAIIDRLLTISDFFNG